MSGFAGVLRSDGAAPDPKLLRQMAAYLEFRGPDGTQVWSRADAGFCFTLLRTGPSPQAEAQPCSLDGQIWLLGEVRLDGREELLDSLEDNHGASGPELTDEELALRVWHKWKEEGLARLRGDFSFAIWDAPAKRLWCARDPLGARPFFYAHVNGQFLFSNTLDALRLSPEVSAKLDFYFIGDFLLQAWCSDSERSAFEDIRRLPAGHLLTYGDGEVRVKRHIRLPIEEPLVLKKPDDYVEQFREHLDNAVRGRVPHAATAVFMSGGLDSTSVAATAKRVQDERGLHDSLRAYTVDYSPLFEDPEEHFASQAAEFVGIPMEVLKGGGCEPFAGWEERGIRTPEPCAEPFFALHVEHYQQVAARGRVVLTGDGGDDILTGRAWPHLVYLARRGRMGSIGRTFAGYFRAHGRFPPLRAGIRTRLQRFVGRSKNSTEFPDWIDPDFARKFHLRDRWRELQEPAESNHPLHPAGYASLTGGYWPSVYETEDAGWTGVPVEARAPLLDQGLIRFLLRLPPVPWCMEKQLLREAMKDRLPDSVRSRPKTPLAGDPLQLHANKKPLTKNGYCDAVRMFVDCRVLTATSRPLVGLFLWNEIRPLALNLWLKAVEKAERIQYSRVGETE